MATRRNQNKRAKRPPASVPRPRRTANKRKNNRARAVQQSIGQRIGAGVGGYLQNAAVNYLAPGFNHLLGFGDYEVVHNTLTKPGSYIVNGAEQVPMMGSGMDGSFRVQHREFLTNISSSVGFSNLIYDINPGLVETFPWISAIAAQFEQYKIMGMTVDYVSTSATSLVSGTNVAMGSVSIATQYNSLSPPFSNLQQLLNYQFATSCKPSENLCHAIECDPGQTPSLPLYVRTGAVTSGDLRLYDLGQVNVATYGSQAVSVIGQLWISYDVMFLKPKLGDSATSLTPMYFGTYYPSTVATRFSDNNPLCDQVIVRYDNIGITTTFTPLGAGRTSCTLSFDDFVTGNYLVTVVWTGSGPPTAAMNMGSIAHSGLNLLSQFGVSTSNTFGKQFVQFPTGDTESSVAGVSFVISPTGLPTAPKMSILFSANTLWSLPASANSVVDVLITPYNSNIGTSAYPVIPIFAA